MGNSKGRAIGAKILHDREIEQSLPTYGKLKEQIEAVRPVAADYKQRLQKYAQDEFVMPQVINNFSILGSRGTGKSSILKTLYQYLQAQNTDPTDFKKQKNILLPSIVPENLVDNISLMGCILGLLKETVDRISDTQENHNSFCPSQPCPLKKKYNELMREFVQLQQPYEQISVQQFSTNSEYTRTITSMLKAGNQFTVQFRHFIDELLSEYADDALLFIFIDDIDLSTNRCGDLVKTLLSYLSHPAIVTVLAGDISIFGEALTLDFLHKEKIPDSEYLQNSYLVEKTQYGHDTTEEKMLERKKQLAYEYLKKVMPPNNRHFIVNWSLSSKRNFCIVQDSEENSSVTLADLLDRLDRHIPLLHHYYGEQKDSLLYYPFDTTARGLASSYHAIQTLVEKLDSSHTDNEEIHLDEFYSDIKFLIESVVASSYQLSIHQHLIFKQFLELGTTLENSSIRFDNFYIWSASTIFHTKAQEKTEETNISATPVLTIKSDIMTFQLFVFLDWTARLLGRNDLFSQIEYQKVKKMMLTSLCTNGYINEGNLYLNKIEQNQFVAISSMSACPLSNILEGYYDLPFPAAVRYFQSFDIPLFLRAAEAKEQISHEIYRQYAIAYVESLEFYYGKESSDLGQYIKENPEMLSFLENQLNYNSENLLLTTLCQKYFYDESFLYRNYIVSDCQHVKGSEEKNIVFNIQNSISENYLQKQTVGDIPDDVKEYIRNLLKNSDLEETNPSTRNIWQDYLLASWLNFVTPSAYSNMLTPFYNAYRKHTENYYDKSKENSYKLKKLNIYSKEELKKIESEDHDQIEIILKIDEQNLWNIDQQFLGEENFISLIVKYITKKLKACEEQFIPKSPPSESLPLEIDISNVQKAYQDFQKIYHGVSDTIAAKCKSNLDSILGDPSSDSFKTKITTAQYMACILILNRLIYSSAWYGKEEARVLKTQLESCECDLFDRLQDPQAMNRYFFWLHCYCRYQAVHLTDSMYDILERAKKAMQSIQDSIKANEDSFRVQYIHTFAEKLGKTPAEIEQFPQWFR